MLARQGKLFPQGFQKECSPADTFILVFCPPELYADKFVLLEATKFVVVCHSSKRKLT